MKRSFNNFFPTHGGAVYYLGKKFNLNPLEIVDLSSSVNPLTKEFLQEITEEYLPYVSLYPPQDSEEVSSFMEETFPVEKKNILWGNGSMELLRLTINLWGKGKRILILEPTFVGYRNILAQNKPKEIINFFSLQRTSWMEMLSQLKITYPKVEMIILCNPNNPTGWIIPKDFLKEIIYKHPEVIFLVDEAFIDFREKESLLNIEKIPENLFIFRSFSKFYGLAGLRLGCVISAEKNIGLLKKEQPTWPVQTLTLVLARALMENKNFKKKTLMYFEEERNYFQERCKNLGIEYFQTTTNFVLFKLQKGESFWQKLLLEKKILLRNCVNFFGLDGDYLRISLKERKWTEEVLETARKWLFGEQS